MIIRIDRLNENGVNIINNVLDEYINAIRSQMFTLDTLSNNYNVVENSGLKEEINSIINSENELINSYINNILVSFKESLLNYRDYKEERKNN